MLARMSTHSPEGMSRKEKPVTCPFCDQRVAKPRPLGAKGSRDETSGGHCACGALYIADVTGKLGGQALMDGLTILCDGDVDAALGLSAGTDYEMVKLGYRPRTHSVERHMPRGGAFGRPKLWFFRRLPPPASA